MSASAAQHRWNNGKAANAAKAVKAARSRAGETRVTWGGAPSLGFKDPGKPISPERIEAFIDRVFT